MNSKEIEILVDNLVILNADSRVTTLNLVFNKYGSEIYRVVVHQLAIRLKEEGLVK